MRGERGENDSHHGVGVSSSIPPLYITRVRDFAWTILIITENTKKVTRPERRDHVTRTRQRERERCPPLIVYYVRESSFDSVKFSIIRKMISSFIIYLKKLGQTSLSSCSYELLTECVWIITSYYISSSKQEYNLPEMVGDCVRRPF